MWWKDFSETVPDLAHRLRDQFEGSGIVLVGTVRANGAPRISPVEPIFEAGQLYLDMMWRSQKALDLLRDPRLEVHGPAADRNAVQYKLYGRAVETIDKEEVNHFAAVCLERLGWQPYTRHHLFRMDIEGAAWISYGEDAPEGYLRVRTWDRPRGYVERGPYPPPGLTSD